MSHASPESPDAARAPQLTNPWFWIFVAMLLAAIRFWQVPFSSLADADTYLAHIATIGLFDHVSRWHVYQEVAERYRAGCPGWFPLAPLPLGLWLLGLSTPVMKTLQYLLIVASFGLFAFVARRLTGSGPAAMLAVVFALCAWQFRTIHDPVIGTSLLTPWSALIVLSAYAAWFAYCESGNVWHLALCYVALVAALMTGPLAWGLGLVLGVTAMLTPHRKQTWGIWGIVATVTAAIALGGAPKPPWQHPATYASDVFGQLFAALPTSFRSVGNVPVARVADLYHGKRYNDDRFILIPAIAFSGWLFATMSAIVAYFATRATSERPPATRRVEALIVGAGYLAVPSLLLGPHGQWQGGLPAGQAFEGVYFEYFGLAIVATVAAGFVFSSKQLAARLAPSVVALAAFVLSYGNARSDAYALAWSESVDAPLAMLARAAAAGFFERLPEGALVVPSASLHYARWNDYGIADFKYALFDYTGRRYQTADVRTLPPDDTAWILSATHDAELPLTLSHWVGGAIDKPLVDRAFGYSLSPGAESAAGRFRGVDRTVVALSDGRLIDARRLCGPVVPDAAFAPSRPTIEWGQGFIPIGPFGYHTESPSPMQSAPGDNPSFFAKMYMGARGIVIIRPSSCPPGTITFRAVAVASRPSHLTIATANGFRRILLDSDAKTFVVRRSDKTRAPWVLVFQTDAPPADWETFYFRYERDVPKERRIVVQPSYVREGP